MYAGLYDAASGERDRGPKGPREGLGACFVAATSTFWTPTFWILPGSSTVQTVELLLRARGRGYKVTVGHARTKYSERYSGSEPTERKPGVLRLAARALRLHAVAEHVVAESRALEWARRRHRCLPSR